MITCSIAAGAYATLRCPPVSQQSIAFAGWSAETGNQGVWLKGWNLSGSDAAATHDVESDGMNNLMEYALGGNPTNADAASVLPALATMPYCGSNWFYHPHNERTDDSSVSYTLEVRSELNAGGWSTNGIEWVGESVIADDFKSVTNRTDIGNQEFIRLEVRQDGSDGRQ